MILKRVIFSLVLVVGLYGFSAHAQTEDIWGQVANYITGEGLNGVAVSLYDSAHTVTYNDVTHTDSALAQEKGYASPLGLFFFNDVPERTDYWVEIVVPEGYTLSVDPNQPPGWNSNPRQLCDCHQADFFLTPVTPPPPPTFQPRTIGFWKHQAYVAVYNQGHAQIPPDELQDLYNAVFDQFNGGTYFPIEGVSSVNGAPLTAADALVTFNLPNGGPQGMVNKAKKQLLGLLLNVEADFVALDYVVSADGHDAEEAIAFIADQITNSGNHMETAKDVADYINNGQVVPAGWIPDGYENIHYSPAPPPLPPSATAGVAGFHAAAYPNPFNPTTSINYQLPNAGQVFLGIYDISGRQVTTLVNGWRTAGSHEVTFDGSNLASGLYFYRLQAGSFSTIGKMMLVK